jgi:adenylate kinase family enzyme
MIVVNLYGGPGAGKSTGAAYVFSRLKMAGINAELVTEFAKDKVYEENAEVFKNQVYILGKQSFRMSRLKDKVDVIVTDCPLFLSAYYNTDPILGDDFNKVVMNVFGQYDNMNFFVDRVKAYNPSGRFQDEKGSDKVATELEKMMTKYGLKFEIVSGDSTGYNYVLDKVFKRLGVEK